MSDMLPVRVQHHLALHSKPNYLQQLVTVCGQSLMHDSSHIRRCSLRLQSEMGDVVYVELPEVGSQLKMKEPFGVVESVKARRCNLGSLESQLSSDDTGDEATCASFVPVLVSRAC